MAREVKFIATETLLEAVILEANMIKKFWPKYNIKDKDGRSFIYIVIGQKEYAHPVLVRGAELRKFPPAKNHIFGPYQSLTLVRNALKIIRRIFPYGTCVPNSGKPCFDYQIGLCPGSCVGAISAKDYQKNINGIMMLLAGDKTRLLKRLVKQNPDQAAALKHVQDVSLLVGEEELGREKQLNRIEAYDISHFAGKESYGAMTVAIDGELDNKEYRLFKIKSAPKNDDLRALVEVLERRLAHEEWGAPDLILLDGGKPQVDFVAKMFKEKNINIPLLGISKFGGDELVYPAGTKPSFKNLAQGIKPILLKAREEAHRFGNRARKKAMFKRGK